MMQANYLHAGHDHSWAEHLLEPLEPMLPGGEKTVGFLGHLLADAGQIYLMLLVVMFAVFLLQTYIDTDRMQRKLAGLKNIWGYLLAFGLGVISPFCSCSIVPVLMGLIAVGVPMSVCLCMLTTASLLNLTAVTALYSLEGVGFASVYLVCSLVIVALSSFLLSRCDLRDAAGTTTWQNTTITTTTAATAGMSITMTTRFRWQNAAAVRCAIPFPSSRRPGSGFC